MKSTWDRCILTAVVIMLALGGHAALTDQRGPKLIPALAIVKSPTPTVLLAASSMGEENLPAVVTGRAWSISYRYACPAGGFFVVSDRATYFSTVLVNVSGDGHGTVTEATPGRHLLAVAGTCSWSLDVTQR